MTAVIALIVGLVFGLGLTVSQMIAPAKVLGFLDLFGAWDASLLFVMAAAVAVTAAGYALARSRGTPMFEPEFRWPPKAAFDGRAAAGGALFGIGWGLAGYCPGPALAALGLGYPGTWMFVVAMLAGMLAQAVLVPPRPAPAH